MTGLLVGDVFRRAATSAPDGVAASLDGRTMTFAALDQKANRIGHALRRAGIGRGDRVAWWGPRASLDALPLFAGLAKIGALFTPLNSELNTAEAAPVLAYLRPHLLVTADTCAETAERVADQAGVSSLACVGRDLGPGLDLRAGTLASNSPADGDRDPTDPELSERDPHVIFMTSGSTGLPKGVVISHRVSCLRTFPPKVPGGQGPILCMFPAFHMAAWNFGLWAWQARNELALVTGSDGDTLLGTASERKANHLYFIPAVWDRVLAALREGHDRWDLSSVGQANTGTSATSPALIAQIRECFPRAVTHVIYGSTEGGNGAVLSTDDVHRKAGSVGRPHPWVELRISDGGEVCLRSVFLMDRYFDRPDETAQALADGWYHTGDMGVLDDEGFLWVAGRLREVIRTGGETVVPSEVEAVLCGVPGVAEVAIVGVPDDHWGEIVCAVVALEPGATVTLESLQDSCHSRLASFKRPRRLEIVASLPRTAATGQIRRRLLLEHLGLGD